MALELATLAIALLYLAAIFWVVILLLAQVLRRNLRNQFAKDFGGQVESLIRLGQELTLDRLELVFDSIRPTWPIDESRKIALSYLLKRLHHQWIASPPMDDLGISKEAFLDLQSDIERLLVTLERQTPFEHINAREAGILQSMLGKDGAQDGGVLEIAQALSDYDSEVERLERRNRISYVIGGVGLLATVVFGVASIV